MGGAGLFSGLTTTAISSAIESDSQKKANKLNREEARRNRRFQRRMRATQYQTATKDMRKAGLNPILAYRQGGAGNLSGAVAAKQESTVPKGLGRDLVNSATSAARTAQEIKNLKASEGQSLSQSELNRALEQKAEQDALATAWSAENLEIQNQMLRLGLPKAENASKFHETAVGKGWNAITETLNLIIEGKKVNQNLPYRRRHR